MHTFWLIVTCLPLHGSACGSASPPPQVASTGPVEPLFFGDIAMSVHNYCPVASDGQHVIVGDPHETSISECAGRAHVFFRKLESLGAPLELRSSDGVAGDCFGGSVSIDQDWIAVGAPAANSGCEKSGAVYVFRLIAGNWKQFAKLVPDEPEQGLMFGSAVALNGDSLVIGAPAYYTNNNNANGTAYVFHFNGTVWQQESRFASLNRTKRDYFGAALAVDDGRAVVVAPGPEGCGGSITVLTRRDNTWVREVTFSPPKIDTEIGSMFAVSVDRDRILIGLPNHDNSGGHGCIFELKDGEWKLTARLIPERTRGAIGHSVRLRDNLALLAIPLPGEGSIVIFNYDVEKDVWVEKTRVMGSRSVQESPVE